MKKFLSITLAQTGAECKRNPFFVVEAELTIVFLWLKLYNTDLEFDESFLTQEMRFLNELRI